ncbi:MAG: hypothetical protein EOO57_02050 [Hymenobacter sp.]|nr:MAG: hypothetical protein EOO57_02050 [Hymenobacter sp.]
MTTRVTSALASLEAAHNIRILHACESGSRAWGFPSFGRAIFSPSSATKALLSTPWPKSARPRA